MPTDPSPSSASSATPRSPSRLRDVALASGLLSDKQLADVEQVLRSGPEGGLESSDPRGWDEAVAAACVQRKLLTRFQARELLAGRRRFTLGQYLVLDEIGRGGMGQVFKAEHGMMGRVVAVKVLPLTKSTPHTEAAFHREIRTLAKLDHENVVRALDAGRDGNVFYLVTEYVPGLDLRRQVTRHGPLDQRQAASVAAQAARGLGYAHRQGIVHRDVKPGNILVSRDGRAKVLDLGLAGSFFDPESMKSGQRVGTPGYMAPEQIRSPQTVGPQADIFGLGCTLYFAVTGQPPFPGSTREAKEQRQLAGPPPAVQALAPDLDRGFAAVIDAMMHPSPERRLSSTEEVIERLRPWLPPAPLPLPRSGLGMPKGTGAALPTTSSGAGASVSSRSDSTNASELNSFGDTIAESRERDDTCSAVWRDPETSQSGEHGVQIFGGGTSRRPPIGSRLVHVGLMAIPISIVAGLASVVARSVFPGWGPSPIWSAVVVFLVLSGAALAVGSDAPVLRRRRL